MAKKNLRENMSVLLLESATEEEKEMLWSLGFKMKKPNKYTVIAAALYKKAAGGDLSAIKELRALVSDAHENLSGLQVVKIIDDIGY